MAHPDPYRIPPFYDSPSPPQRSLGALCGLPATLSACPCPVFFAFLLRLRDDQSHSPTTSHAHKARRLFSNFSCWYLLVSSLPASPSRAKQVPDFSLISTLTFRGARRSQLGCRPAYFRHTCTQQQITTPPPAICSYSFLVSLPTLPAPTQTNCSTFDPDGLIAHSFLYVLSTKQLETRHLISSDDIPADYCRILDDAVTSRNRDHLLSRRLVTRDLVGGHVDHDSTRTGASWHGTSADITAFGQRPSRPPDLRGICNLGGFCESSSKRIPDGVRLITSPTQRRSQRKPNLTVLDLELDDTSPTTDKKCTRWTVYPSV